MGLFYRAKVKARRLDPNTILKFHSLFFFKSKLKLKVGCLFSYSHAERINQLRFDGISVHQIVVVFPVGKTQALGLRSYNMNPTCTNHSKSPKHLPSVVLQLTAPCRFVLCMIRFGQRGSPRREATSARRNSLKFGDHVLNFGGSPPFIFWRKAAVRGRHLEIPIFN